MFVKMKDWTKFFIFASVISNALLINTNNEITTNVTTQKNIGIRLNSTMKTANSDNSSAIGQSTENEFENTSTTTLEINTQINEITSTTIENEITTFINLDSSTVTTEEVTTDYETISDISTESISYYPTTENIQYETIPTLEYYETSTNQFETSTLEYNGETTFDDWSIKPFGSYKDYRDTIKSSEITTENSNTITEIPYYTYTEETSNIDTSSDISWLTDNEQIYKNQDYTITDYSDNINTQETTFTNTEETTNTGSSSKMFWLTENIQDYTTETSTKNLHTTTKIPSYLNLEETFTNTEETTNTDSSSEMFWLTENIQDYTTETSTKNLHTTTKIPSYLNLEETFTNTEETTNTDSSSEMFWLTENIQDYTTETSTKNLHTTTKIPSYLNLEETFTNTEETTNTDSSSEMFWLTENNQFYKNQDNTETSTALYTDTSTEDSYTTTNTDTTSEMFWLTENIQYYKNQDYTTKDYAETSTLEESFTSTTELNTEYTETTTETVEQITDQYFDSYSYTNHIFSTEIPTTTNFILEEYSNTIEDTTLETTTDTTTYTTTTTNSETSESTEPTKPTEPSKHCAEDIKIEELNIFSSKYSIFVNWSIPNTACGYTYLIEWEQKLERIKSSKEVDDTEILINNLNACAEYEINLIVFYENTNIASTSRKGTTLEFIEPIEYINNKYDEKDGKLSVFWNIPTRVKNCLKKYNLQIIKNGIPTEKLIIRDDTVTFIIGWQNCINYTYIVSACSENYESSENHTTYLKTTLNSPPIFNKQETIIDDNYVKTKWNFGKNICRPTKFIITCTSSNDKCKTEGEFNIDKNELIATIQPGDPYENYTCYGIIENDAGDSKASEPGIFLTKSKPPTMPSNLTMKQFDNEYIFITWDEPEKWNGVPLHYNVLIEFLKLNYIPSTNCEKQDFELINKTVSIKEKEYKFTDILVPASTYEISVVAQSDGGFSEFISKNIVLKDESPESPNVELQLKTSENKNYNMSVNVSWTEPCKMNGLLIEYNVQLIQNFTTLEEHNISVEENRMWFIFNKLKPEFEYSVQVFAKNENFDSETKQKSFTTPAGIPLPPKTSNIKEPSTSDVEEPWKTAAVYISDDIFDKSMGDIIYYSIIVASTECKESRKRDYYKSGSWPQVSSDKSNCADEFKAYEATDQMWNPFKSSVKSSKSYKFILGTNESCTKNNCNKPLKSNTEYCVKIRGFTKNGYSDTDIFEFITDSDVPVGLIVGLIVGILVIAFIIAAVLFYTKGKLNFKNWPRMESTTQISPAPLPVSIKKFGPHYEKMIENPGKIKNEFQLLSTISSDVTLSTKTALLPINKKKNRYINILPYDQTRVKLIDTKANSSDYINASYIKGYSGSNEYIAAQGPTETTCPFFWQMILEQNIKLIVMLTQCVEAGKDKCYKYYPDLKEEYDLLNDIKIICIEEETLSLYNLRTLIVKKNNVSRKITHMQFIMWPDFGVPDTVQYIINFCEAVREAKMKKPSIILMHCSAGVGRTGTLIAVDILMQTIRDKRKVDIFGSVLNLRKQRMQMVQSEKQYEFLYKCVQYMIANKSTTPTIKNNLRNISESKML